MQSIKANCFEKWRLNFWHYPFRKRKPLPLTKAFLSRLDKASMRLSINRKTENPFL